MSAISAPAYAQVKQNIVTILEAVSAAEVTAGSKGFTVERDRYRNFEYTEDLTAKVNVMMSGMTPEPGGNQRYTPYRCTFEIGMYVIGGCTRDELIDEELVTIPANIEAADRLDLLVAQVLFGLTQLLTYDLGMTPGTITKGKPTLTMSNQVDDQSTTVFAPAKFTLECVLPYMAADNAATYALPGVTVTMQKALESVQLNYTYGD